MTTGRQGVDEGGEGSVRVARDPQGWRGFGESGEGSARVARGHNTPGGQNFPPPEHTH